MCFIFLSVCIVIASWPVECVPLALVKMSSVCVSVINGRIKVLCDRGIRCVSMLIGLSVSVLKLCLIRVILLI